MGSVAEAVDYASVSLEQASPPHTVGFSDARRTLPALIKQVSDTGVRAVITRYEKPAVAVVPLADLRRLEAQDAEKAKQLEFSQEVDASSLQNFMEPVVEERPSQTHEPTVVADEVLASVLSIPEIEGRLQEIAALALKQAVAHVPTGAVVCGVSADAIGKQLHHNMLEALSYKR